jgi:hypothetical protein
MACPQKLLKTTAPTRCKCHTPPTPDAGPQASARFHLYVLSVGITLSLQQACYSLKPAETAIVVNWVFAQRAHEWLG